MGLPYDDLAQSRIGLLQLSVDLTKLEQRIKADWPTEMQPYAQQVSDLCAQVQSVVDQVSAMGHQIQVDPPPSTVDPDQCWFALKAAIYAYRNSLSLRSSTRAAHES